MERTGIYLGTDLKFALAIDTMGFDIDRDEFSVTVTGMKGSVTINKDEMLQTQDGRCIFTYSTLDLGSGEHWMKVTAYVPDPDFENGIRKEVIKKLLCKVST